MKVKNSSYVLMLVYIDNDWMDIGGNRYPVEGYIESQQFTRDIDIEYGLCGIPWGKTYYFPYEQINGGKWLVVKTELNEELIRTDFYYNRYKFRNGFVVHAGNIKSAAKYIIKNKNEDEFIKEAEGVQLEEVAGSTKWLKKYKLEYEV